MQFHSHPQSSRSQSFLIPFNSRPVTPFQNHVLALGEEILGKSPQLIFKPDSKLVVPHIVTQLSGPSVLVQPNSGNLGGELASEYRLTRGWKPTDEHEPRR